MYKINTDAIRAQYDSLEISVELFCMDVDGNIWKNNNFYPF